MVKFDETFKKETLDLWNKAKIEPSKQKEVESQVKNYLIKNKDKYLAVSTVTGVPWHVIGCIHYMEASCSFKTHLHNGDSLNARTVQVPAGRPKTGNPPFTWEESAIDALGYDHLFGEKDWSLPHVLFLFESYNGFGYRTRNCLSPYIWSGTTVQTKGLFVADGKFDANKMSTRCACAAMLKTLIAMGEIVLPNESASVPTIPEWINLKNGSKGEKVKELQKELNEHFSAKLTPDGDFGNYTEKAVKTAEQKLHIPVDGVITEGDLNLIKEYKAPVMVPSEPSPSTDSNLALIVEAKKWVGVHEQGGNNKGKEVEIFQKAVDGQSSGEAWCMAFVQYCIKQTEATLGIKSKIYRSEHCLTVWGKSPTTMRLTKPEVGCVVIWQHGTTSSGHTGFVTGVDANGNLLTIEGNTNGAGSRDGDGVFSKTRNKTADGTLKVVGFLKVF